MPRSTSSTSPPLPQAIGYARVSTPGQATESISLSAPKDKLRLWAEAHGYQLVSVHEDAGLSGGRADNRPGLQAVLDIVCAARGALAIIHQLRGQGFTLRGIGQELQRRKVKSKQGLDTWTPKVIRDVLLRENPVITTAGASR